MNKLNEEEAQGRNKFDSFVNQFPSMQWWWSEERYNQLDGWLEQHDNLYAVEIKNRFKHYDTYMIEQSKAEFLKDLINSGSVKDALYVNYVNDNMYMYKISKIDWNKLNLEYFPLPQYHYKEGSIVGKWVYWLPVTWATTFKKINNEWIKQTKK